jgi:hypothetical protein
MYIGLTGVIDVSAKNKDKTSALICKLLLKRQVSFILMQFSTGKRRFNV